jgi:hypothetical protein
MIIIPSQFITLAVFIYLFIICFMAYGQHLKARGLPWAISIGTVYGLVFALRGSAQPIFTKMVVKEGKFLNKVSIASIAFIV